MSIAEYPLRRRRFRIAPTLSRDARRRLRWVEFYLAHARGLRLAGRPALLQAWEEIYNSVRPHQALGYLTPNEFLARWHATLR